MFFSTQIAFKIEHNLFKKTITHPLQESSFFTQLGDVCSVVVSKHLISKNGISNLGRSNTFKLQVSLY